MTITIDNTKNTKANFQSGTYNTTHTCSANTKLLIVITNISDATSNVSGVTYNGNAMTLGEETTGASDKKLKFWYLKTPDTGSDYTIATTLDGLVDSVSVTSISVEGTVGGFEFDNSGVTSGNGSPSINLTTYISDTIVFEAFYSDQGISTKFTIGSGQTELNLIDAGDVHGASYKVVSSAGANAMSWTDVDNDEDWIQLAVAFKEIADDTTGLAQDIVSYYKMNGVGDSHSTNTGTATYPTLVSSGIIGSAYSFDGTDDDISIPTGVNTTSYGNYTISMWLYVTDITPPTSHVPFSSINGTVWNPWIGISTSNRTYFQWSNSSYMQIATSSYVTEGAWNHFVFVYDDSAPFAGSARGHVWINGVSVDTYSGSVTGRRGNDASPTSYFGRTLTTGNYFPGSIDEVGIWSRALASSEVALLYNSGDGLTYPFVTGGSSGYSNTVIGVSSPAKINGVAVADITAFNGV